MPLSPFSAEYMVLQQLPPRIQGAVLEVHQKTGAPVEIVLLVAISAMSSALHGVAIRTPNGRLMPTSLYCMGIAPPVSGKSSAMAEFYKPIRAFDERLAQRREASAEARNDPALRDILQLDATWSSLLEALTGTGHGLTIADDDCFDQMKGDVLRKRGKLNRLFDGAAKESLIRRDQDPLVAYRPSLGICFLTQPNVFAEHQQVTRHADRHSGLASRFLYAHTLEGRAPVYPNRPTPTLGEIHQLMNWMLEQRSRRLESGEGPVELQLSADAESRWSALKNNIDTWLVGQPQLLQESGGRATEKVWRIAAALHCYAWLQLPASSSEPLPAMPPIPPEMIDAGWAVVEWSLWQLGKAFPPPAPKAPKPSRVLERQREETRLAKRHLFEHLRRTGEDTLAWSLAQELSWLSAHKFKTVLAHMKSTQLVEVVEGKDPILRFAPAFFTEMTAF